MAESQAVRAIRALRLLRDHRKEMRGDEYRDRIIQQAVGSQRGTDVLQSTNAWGLNTIHLLLRAGLIVAKHRQDGLMDATTFKEKLSGGGPYALSNFHFSVSPTLTNVQEALGTHSLTDLEKRAMGDTIAVAPVFGIPRNTHFLRRDVFVVMPFAPEMKIYYDEAIVPVCQQLGLFASRADDFFTNNAVMADVWGAIFSASMIIADCTGRNVNVFYELGMAHTIGKPTIIVSQDEADIPFDVRQFRYVVYDSVEDLRQKLKPAVAKLMEVV